MEGINQPTQETAAECGQTRGEGWAIPTDVTDERAVRNLARRVIEQYGRIDAWVNNAAVSLFARFEEAPPEAYRRVIETNLFGYIHGARAVLPFFREQGSGVLINNASFIGKIGSPYVSAYSVNKFGIVASGKVCRWNCKTPRESRSAPFCPLQDRRNSYQLQWLEETGRTGAEERLEPVVPT
jgi:NAD(P)-dependent dehydrogenase (short-subunit alcohol dehydrogenase family)